MSTPLTRVWLVWDLALGGQMALRGIYTDEARAAEMVGHFEAEARNFTHRADVAFVVEETVLDHAFGHEDVMNMIRVLRLRAARSHS